MPVVNRKLFWLAFWVTGFAVVMTGLLLYIKYSNALTSLQRERVMLVAGEIDGIAEKNLSLGQDFWEIATLQEVIERRRTADPIFLSIEVAGKDGKIAYSTDLARIGSSLPPEWLPIFARQASTGSLSRSADEAVAASVIRNSYEQIAGFAVIRYDRHLEHRATRAIAKRLIVNCIGLIAVFTLLLYWALARIWDKAETQFLLASDALLALGQTTPNSLAYEVNAIKIQVDAAKLQLGVATGAMGAIDPESIR